MILPLDTTKIWPYMTVCQFLKIFHSFVMTENSSESQMLKHELIWMEIKTIKNEPPGIEIPAYFLRRYQQKYKVDPSKSCLLYFCVVCSAGSFFSLYYQVWQDYVNLNELHFTFPWYGAP